MTAVPLSFSDVHKAPVLQRPSMFCDYEPKKIKNSLLNLRCGDYAEYCRLRITYSPVVIARFRFLVGYGPNIVSAIFGLYARGTCELPYSISAVGPQTEGQTNVVCIAAHFCTAL